MQVVTIVNVGAEPIRITEIVMAGSAGGVFTLQTPGLPTTMEPGDRLDVDVTFTPVANVTGMAGMSVPLYWNDAGLPIGSQFLARRGADELLLELAFQLEQAQPWADRWAPNSAKFI